MKNRLLIVDDQKVGREALEKILSFEGYQIICATCGQEALQKAEEHLPDLILLDVVMPDMDGFEVCSRLRLHPTLADVPIIMLTAFNDRQSRVKGIEVGADDFISKPFDTDELRARVRTITRLNRYRRLLAERSRFEWAVEQSNDGYLLLKKGDIIQYANSSARFYLGILKEGCLPASFKELFQQKLYKSEPEIAWQNWPQPNIGSTPRFLVCPETKQTSSLWLQVDILELPSDKTNSQLVHLRDVSENMNLQQQMWTFQTLVSHKLRGPLNGLVSLQMLDEQLMNLNSQRAHTLLKIARESAKRLQDQILDILRYIDSSQLLQVKTTFEVHHFPTLIEKIQQDLEIKNTQLHLHAEITDQHLLLSPQSMELILRELFTNSKKFHPQNQPDIEIYINLTNSQSIHLRFTDNGCCITDKEIDKVWIPYYQSEKHFTGEIKGMGLGLAMIARLVWSCGGRCTLSNRPDRPGVCAELILPIRRD